MNNYDELRQRLARHLGFASVLVPRHMLADLLDENAALLDRCSKAESNLRWEAGALEIKVEALEEKLAQLEAENEALRAALSDYMAAFGQGLEAHGIPFGEQQEEADIRARKALGDAS